MCNFKIGEEVVCIKRDAWVSLAGPADRYPVYGRVYTVADKISHPAIPEEIFLALEEFDPLDHWHSAAFRPVAKRRASIAVSQRMLLPTKVTEPA